jgi:hypothetical protein
MQCELTTMPDASDAMNITPDLVSAIDQRPSFWRSMSFRLTTAKPADGTGEYVILNHNLSIADSFESSQHRTRDLLPISESVRTYQSVA